MRASLLACAISALLCVPITAFAQKHGGGGPVNGGKGGASNAPSGKIVVEHNGGTYEALARSRAAAGDCNGALDAFDAALETSIDPELHRDRGICHEKLGHPYPAIDDYRYYLTYRPNAADAEAIHQRLDSLLAQVVQMPADKATDNSDDKKDKAASNAAEVDAEAKGEAGVSLSSAHNPDEEASADANASSGKTVDAIDADEKLAAQANASSLRRGKGFVLGPYFEGRNWGKSGYGWGEAIGCAFRYSLGAPSSIVTEVGYSQINATGSDTKLGGLMLFGGYEARLGLDDHYTNAILFQGGLGYERLTQGGTGLIASIVLPRVRGGFRHVFGPSVGLELGIDAGYGFVHVVDSDPSANDSTLMIGGEVALLVGF